MRAKESKIEELAARYWSAELTPTEEQELREAVEEYRGEDEQIVALKVMLGGFEDIASEQSMEAQPRSVDRAKVIRLVASLTAVAAMFAVVLLTFTQQSPAVEADIYCYINGEPITDINIALEQTKYFEQIEVLEQTLNRFESILN